MLGLATVIELSAVSAGKLFDPREHIEWEQFQKGFKGNLRLLFIFL